MKEQTRNQAPETAEPAVRTNSAGEEKELDAKEPDQISGGGLVVGTLATKPV